MITIKQFNPIETQDTELKLIALKARQLRLRLRSIELDLIEAIGRHTYESITINQSR